VDHRRHIDNAIVNPARSFRHPSDVVTANDMATTEKLAILKAWQADERALQRAESEGMGGGEHSHLHRVQDALIRLELLAKDCLRARDKCH